MNSINRQHSIRPQMLSRLPKSLSITQGIQKHIKPLSIVQGKSYIHWSVILRKGILLENCHFGATSFFGTLRFLSVEFPSVAGWFILLRCGCLHCLLVTRESGFDHTFHWFLKQFSKLVLLIFPSILKSYFCWQERIYFWTYSFHWSCTPVKTNDCEYLSA